MFAVHCPRHGARVLIWTSLIERVRNTDDGIAVDYRCTCGHRGTWRTGLRARTQDQPLVAEGRLARSVPA